MVASYESREIQADYGQYLLLTGPPRAGWNKGLANNRRPDWVSFKIVGILTDFQRYSKLKLNQFLLT